MENVRKSPGYAESQIRLLLSELANSSQAVRVKAIKTFQTYVGTYTPEIYDDDIDFLYTGFNAEINRYTTQGLLYYAGMKSEKHDGQLKRICGPAIGLLRWLIVFKGYEDDGGGNIFYDRFIQLPQEDLMKVNFTKHIIQDVSKESNLLKVKAITGESRSGSAEDAMELLSFLVRDHRGPNGEADPVDLNALIENNKACADKFLKWLQKTATEQMNTALSLESISNKKEIKVVRPRTWKDLQFKPVPLQEGEMGVLEAVDDSVDNKAPVADPLGIQDVDLRVAQELHDGALKTGRKSRKNKEGRRSLSALNPVDKIAIMAKVERGIAEKDAARRRPSLEENDDAEDEPDSLLPTEKSFNPTLFLTFVHSNASYNELLEGSKHLEGLLDEQSSRRVNIVREHFGLFVLCAETLEWLKLSRKAGADAGEEDGSGLGSISNRGARAQALLNTAQVEAQNALAPLLYRHKRSREIRKAEQDLKNISSIIEVPREMHKAFESGHFEDVVATYSKVVKLSKVKANTDSASSVQIIEKIKAKADAIMEDLKGKCQKAMKQNGRAPDVDNILRFSKVLCSFDAVNDSSEPDPSIQLQHLRSAFDDYIAQFTGMFKSIFEELKVAGKQVIVSGEALQSDAAVTKSYAALEKMRNFDESARRRRRSNTNDASFLTAQLRQAQEEEEGEHEEIGFVDDADDADDGTDFNNKIFFEVRLVALKRIVDKVEEWMPEMHRLAILVTGQKVAASGKKSNAGSVRTPATAALAKEVLKVTSLSISLVKGLSESSLAWSSDDSTILTRPHFTAPLSSKFLADGYEEIFSIYELLSDFSTNWQDESVDTRTLYNDAVALLKGVVIEGEILAASAAAKLYDQKVSTIVASLEQLKTTHKSSSPDHSLASLKASGITRSIVKASNDFEFYTMRTLRRLYSRSNRPEWIVEIVRDGLFKTFQKLLNCLEKVALESAFNKIEEATDILATEDLVDFESLEALLEHAENSEDIQPDRYLFEVIRVCIYLRVIVIPKVAQEIAVQKAEKIATRRNSSGRISSISSVEDEADSRAHASIIHELNNLVVNLENSVVVRYLELKTWAIRSAVSGLYYNLVVKYESFSIKSPEYPLTCMLTMLTAEKESIEQVFSSGLQLFMDNEDTQGSDKRSSGVASYGYVLFAELCKQMANFYIDVVFGLFTGSALKMLDLVPNSGIVLPLWNRREIIMRRRSELDKLILPKSSLRAKANAMIPSCPWPLLFDRAASESNYFSEVTRKIQEKASSFQHDVATKSLPISQLQIKLDPEAFYGRAITNLADDAVIATKMKCDSLLLLN